MEAQSLRDWLVFTTSLAVTGVGILWVSKSRWCKTYLELPSDSLIVEAFGSLGSLSLEECTLQANSMLYDSIRPIEAFVCLVYKAEGPFTLPDLRWHLFKTKNLESENLRPTRATLLPHLQRTNYVCKIHKSYDTTHPILPALTENGWQLDKKTWQLKPVYCLMPPALKTILGLIKCGCGGNCSTNSSSCFKNELPCTSLCKCSENYSNDTKTKKKRNSYFTVCLTCSEQTGLCTDALTSLQIQYYHNISNL